MIIIIVILIDLFNPLKTCVIPDLFLLSYLDLQAFLLQTGVKIQENVIPDSFRSMFFAVFFPQIVMARGVSSDAGLHPSNTRSRIPKLHNLYMYLSI